MTRNTAPNSSNKVSIRLQEFPLFVTSLMSQSVITQPCYSAILAITCHLFIYAPVTLIVQKGVGTRSHPTTPLALVQV